MSNAVSERGFSKMNYIKSKRTSRMSTGEDDIFDVSNRPRSAAELSVSMAASPAAEPSVVANSQIAATSANKNTLEI